LDFKKFRRVDAYGAESDRDGRFYEKPILEQRKLLLGVLWWRKVVGLLLDKDARS